MMKKLGIVIGTLAIAGLAVLGLVRPGESQSGGNKLTLAVYTPTVEFGSSAAAFQYTQGLAKAIEQRVGQPVEGKFVSSYGQATKADFAVIDAQCYAVKRRSFSLLANGGGSRQWALFSSVGSQMTGLRGKKIAYVRTGCNDKGFLENAMLESEVDLGYFSGTVRKDDIGGAVAAVASYKQAQGVFAPVGSQKGLTKVFDTGAVPGPAFVQVNSRLPSSVVEKAQSAVVSYGGGGAIRGWTSGNDRTYRALAGRMQPRIKRGIFASPNFVRIDDKGVVEMPKTLDDTALPQVEQHFQAPPKRQE